VGGTREGEPEGLPFHLGDSLELVNWTGRAVRDDKRGAIANDLPPILERTGITRAAWLQLAKDFETHFCTWIGQAEHVERICERGGQHWDGATPGGVTTRWKKKPGAFFRASLQDGGESQEAMSNR